MVPAAGAASPDGAARRGNQAPGGGQASPDGAAPPGNQPPGGVPAPPDLQAALAAWAGAVALVTFADGRDDIGTTVSAFCPVSTDPPLVLVSLIAASYPVEVLGRVDAFAVTLLAASQRALAGRFAAAGRPGARLLLENVPHHRGPLSGALIPDGGLAAIECRVTSRLPAGDHVLLVAAVRSVRYVADSGDPLIRFRGRYLR